MDGYDPLSKPGPAVLCDVPDGGIPDVSDPEIGEKLRRQGLILDGEDLTVLFDRWTFVQASRGYRFGIDSVVLARYAVSSLREPGADAGANMSPAILDIGAGCGVIGILTASELPGATVTAVEIQPGSADRARRNVCLNGLVGRVYVVEGDICELAGPHVGPDVADRCPRKFDFVVSNPPFYRHGTGRVNPDGERAIARHELRLTMKDLLCAIAAVLAPEGHAALLYPAERLVECLATLPAAGLAAHTLVPLLPRPGAPAESYLIDMVMAGPGSAPARTAEPTFADPIPMDRGHWEM